MVISADPSGISIWSVLSSLVTHTTRARCKEGSAIDSLTSYTASSNTSLITVEWKDEIDGRGEGG